MAYKFATNSSGPGVRYDLGSTDSLSVPVGVTITSDDDNAISASGNGIRIKVLGYVGGTVDALYLTYSGGSATNRSVLIGASGVLDGGVGVYDYGSGDRITNYGQIYGYTGIQLGTSAPSGAVTTLYNYGTIEAERAIESLTMNLRLFNYGRINGDHLGAILTSYSTDMIYNKGIIDGLVQLGQNDDTLYNRGFINGNVGMGDGIDLLDNRSGTIEGLIGLGDGNDTIMPGASAETADGGINEDTIDFTRSSGVHFALDGSIDATGWAKDDVYTNFEDVLGSNTGGDVLVGDSFGNILNGNGGNDTITGQGGADTLLGGRGNDTLDGGTGSDQLIGGAGNDILLGGDDADTLIGGLGNDTLTGGLGADTLEGDRGADRFVFDASDVGGTTRNEGGHDTVYDFSTAEADRIDLSAVDANTLVSRDQAFTFIGSAAFHSVAGELRFEQSGNGAYVEGDTNGDGVADFSIFLLNDKTPVAADFVL